MRNRNRTKKLTLLTMLLAMAIVVSMIESQVDVGVPGARLGLANALGLIALSLFGVKEMLVLNMMRVLIVGLMRGTLLGMGFWISFFGTLLASIAAIVANRAKIFTPIGVSLVSATFHNIGQVMFVSVVTNAPMLFFTYLPFMLLMGIPTGIVTGHIVKTINNILN